MDTKRAIQILSALADGVDPYTGEVLPSDGPFQEAETVRALFLAIKGLENPDIKEKKLKDKPNNAGKPWSKEEDDDLAKGFDAGVTVKELSEKHGRTRGAIQTRLIRIGKIQP